VTARDIYERGRAVQDADYAQRRLAVTPQPAALRAPSLRCHCGRSPGLLRSSWAAGPYRRWAGSLLARGRTTLIWTLLPCPTPWDTYRAWASLCSRAPSPSPAASSGIGSSRRTGSAWAARAPGVQWLLAWHIWPGHPGQRGGLAAGPGKRDGW